MTTLEVAPAVPDIASIRLNGAAVTGELRDALTAGTWESRIDGATVVRLTFHDPDRTIRRSTDFTARTVVEIDGRRYEVADTLTRGSFVTLVCDDWIRAELGEHAGWLAAPAEITTRAGFVQLLAAQAGVPVEVDPNAATVNVALARGTDRTDQRAGASPAGSYPAGAGHPVVSRSAWPSEPDLAIAATIAIVAREVGASDRATLAAFEAALAESRMHNLGFGDRDSIGVMQQRDAWAPAELRLNPAEAIRMFFRGGQAGQKGALHYDATGISYDGTVIGTAGQLAQAVQVSAHPGRYDQQGTQATALMAAAGQQAGPPVRQQPPETSWDCGQRLARERLLRSLSDGDRWLFGSDDWLRGRAAPVILRERTGGIGDIDWEIRSRVPVDQVRIDVTTARWSVAAGHPVELVDAGPATGADWLVGEISGDLFTSPASLTLQRAHVPLPEPIAPVNAGAGAGGFASGGVSRTGFSWPTVDGRVISVWGDPRDGGSRRHKGIDIADTRGATIYAAKDGIVTVAHDRDDSTYGGYGRVVYIDHPDGWQTRYAHNTANLVDVGQQVLRGQPIATVGDSGNARGTPPHNHFETRHGGNAVDPQTVLPAR